MLFQLQAIPSTLQGILIFNTIDGSTTMVATNPDNGRDAERERKRETQLCRSECCQKMEDPWRRSTATQVLDHESRKRHRSVFSHITTSPPTEGNERRPKDGSAKVWRENHEPKKHLPSGKDTYLARDRRPNHVQPRSNWKPGADLGECRM